LTWSGSGDVTLLTSSQGDLYNTGYGSDKEFDYGYAQRVSDDKSEEENDHQGFGPKRLRVDKVLKYANC
jgi:hypothetical protein